MDFKPINVLLADDDTDDCLFFKDAIMEVVPEKNFTAVHDGEQLMQLLLQETNQIPDILFLDLNMPRKNGFECLSEIRQNKKLKSLPIIIFSTSYEQEMVNLLYENGAQYYIRKPTEFLQFKKIILHTLTIIMQKNMAQPRKESFVITPENSLTI